MCASIAAVVPSALATEPATFGVDNDRLYEPSVGPTAPLGPVTEVIVSLAATTTV